MRELLLGCGNRRKRVICYPGLPDEYQGLVTLDIDPNCGADVIWDLSTAAPLPFPDNHFDTVSAFEVLEHIGQQGDYKTFFRQFSDYWRVLKPDGLFFGSSPKWNSPWLFGDPGHTRLVSEESLIFLDQDSYAQCGQSPMTDYRWLYKANLRKVFAQERGHSLFFVLKAIKP